MFSQIIAHEVSKSVRLSLQDVLEGRYEKSKSRYLSLSVNYSCQDIKINFTTTDKEAITYVTVVPAVGIIDSANLIFEVLPKSARA